MDASIRFIVNGEERTVTTDPDRSLLDVLREDLHLTGTKYGCGEGQCGACAVLVDGERIASCETRISQVAEKHVTTIEGLAKGDRLHPVQEAFLAEGAMQCGYCTPGMIIGTVALLRKHPHPTDQEIERWMHKHLCRCCGYPKIVQAIRRAEKSLSEGGTP